MVVSGVTCGIVVTSLICPTRDSFSYGARQPLPYDECIFPACTLLPCQTDLRKQGLLPPDEEDAPPPRKRRRTRRRSATAESERADDSGEHGAGELVRSMGETDHTKHAPPGLGHTVDAPH